MRHSRETSRELRFGGKLSIGLGFDGVIFVRSEIGPPMAGLIGVRLELDSEEADWLSRELQILRAHLNAERARR